MMQCPGTLICPMPVAIEATLTHLLWLYAAEGKGKPHSDHELGMPRVPLLPGALLWLVEAEESALNGPSRASPSEPRDMT